MNTLGTLSTAFTQFLSQQFDPPANLLAACTLTLNVDAEREQFGDLSSNAAMVLAKHRKENPRAIATAIAEQFTLPAIDHIEIAGPGFLNIFLNTSAIQELASQLFEQGEAFFKPAEQNVDTKISLEFVSCNPTGPLHFGHGRGGIIGDVLAKVLKFLERDTTTEYYINDAGSQMERLGISFKVRCLQALGMDAVMPEDGYQGQYLIDLAQECVKEYGESLIEEKPASFFTQEAEKAMLERIRTTLDAYGIYFDVWFSERTLHEDGSIATALEELKSRGHLYEEEGALWFRATTFGDDKDRVVRKADGQFTYLAADIAYLRNKVERGFTTLLMLLGHDHHGYVSRLQGLLQALGYTNTVTLEIILYQLVKLKEGGQQLKMSKRAGTMVHLSDVIEMVGRDVARFFFLNRRADAQLEFDLALALKRTDENPVYYIQYAYVRTNSISQKAAQHEALQNITAADAQHLSRDEALLIKKMASLGEMLNTIARNHQTHLLAYYSVELAQLFSRYYAKHMVVDVSNVNQSRGRLLLVTTLNRTLATVFKLLGISAPERM